VCGGDSTVGSNPTATAISCRMTYRNSEPTVGFAIPGFGVDISLLDRGLVVQEFYCCRPDDAYVAVLDEHDDGG
jgi:hypothetical protein